MINFANVTTMTIPEGNVVQIANALGSVLWKKQTAPIYTELEYIESTGTQWIDTGKYAPLNTDIEVTFKLNSATNGAIFGGRATQTAQTCTLFYLASTNPNSFRFDRAGQTYVANANQISIDTESIYEFSLKNNTAKITNQTTGESSAVYIGTPSSFTPNSINLFAVNGGTILNGRIYGWKYWEDGVLLQDFIPVLDFNDIPCMYDKVSNEFFYNQGTGNFLYGEIPAQKYKTELAYLESTGTQFIDTGIIGADGITADGSVYRTTTSANECFCGAFDGTHRLWLIYTFGNNWYRGYNGTAGPMCNSTPSEQWVEIKMSINNGTVTHNINGTEYTARYTRGFSAINNVYLFAMGTNSGASYYGRCRMAYCKLYDNDTLVRDFIPVLDSNDVPCMYDKVTDELFYNKGTGEFLYSTIIGGE